jgi:hypothetical protein
MADNSSDSRTKYADIIDMPRHTSTKHAQMSLHDRAAQFSPFAALTGYGDMVDEEARLTQNLIDIDEQTRVTIDRKLAVLASELSKGNHPAVSVTYFVPDTKKAGGNYVTSIEEIKKIDTIERKLILSRVTGFSKMNASLDIDMIIGMDGDIFKDL